MYQKCVGVLAGLGLAATAAQGATITVANTDITVSGGAAGGVYYSEHTGDSSDVNFLVSDYLLQLSHDAKTAGDIGFTAAVGQLQEISILDGGGSRAYNSPDYGIGLQYGWLSYMPVDGLTFQVGKLATNLGSEVPPSYSNPNITLGALWSSQPTYYDGVRATYSMGGMNVYVEADKDPTTADTQGRDSNAAAIGVNGTIGTINYSLSDFNYVHAGSPLCAKVTTSGVCLGPFGVPHPDNYVDFIVGNTINGWTTGLDFNYDTLQDAVKTQGLDGSGYGVALYATPPKYGKWTVPMRVEYLHDGTSYVYGQTYPAQGVFGMGHGYTLTVTPTYHVTDNTFIRAEASYVQTGDPVFINSSDSHLDKEKFSAALQAGVTF